LGLLLKLVYGLRIWLKLDKNNTDFTKKSIPTYFFGLYNIYSQCSLWGVELMPKKQLTI